MKCNKPCLVYSRVVGYHNPTKQWNKGKREEFKERTPFNLMTSLQHPLKV